MYVSFSKLPILLHCSGSSCWAGASCTGTVPASPSVTGPDRHAPRGSLRAPRAILSCHHGPAHSHSCSRERSTAALGGNEAWGQLEGSLGVNWHLNRGCDKAVPLKCGRVLGNIPRPPNSDLIEAIPGDVAALYFTLVLCNPLAPKHLGEAQPRRTWAWHSPSAAELPAAWSPRSGPQRSGGQGVSLSPCFAGGAQQRGS